LNLSGSYFLKRASFLDVLDTPQLAAGWFIYPVEVAIAEMFFR
jgi:hypothetical protein